MDSDLHVYMIFISLKLCSHWGFTMNGNRNKLLLHFSATYAGVNGNPLPPGEDFNLKHFLMPSASKFCRSYHQKKSKICRNDLRRWWKFIEYLKLGNSCEMNSCRNKESRAWWTCVEILSCFIVALILSARATLKSWQGLYFCTVFVRFCLKN